MTRAIIHRYHFDVELAIETGKIAIADMWRPLSGSMAEYCVHLRNPRVPLHIWANAIERRSPKGVRYQVHGVWVSSGLEVPDRATHKVGDVSFGGSWIVVGDLTFIHGRSAAAGAYASAMGALKRSCNMGGVYEASATSRGVAFRLALKELRMPMQLDVRDGIFESLSFEVDPRWIIGEEGEG